MDHTNKVEVGVVSLKPLPPQEEEEVVVEEVEVVEVVVERQQQQEQEQIGMDRMVKQSLVLERSNPFPVLAAPSKLAAPLSSEFLLALLGLFCSQVHQTTSPMLASSCSHIDPDSMQVL